MPSKVVFLRTSLRMGSPAFSMRRSARGNMEFFADEYIRWLAADRGVAAGDYFNDHLKRFRETETLMSSIGGRRVLEIGAIDYMQLFLSHRLGFTDVWGSYFSTDVDHKYYRRTVEGVGRTVEVTAVSVNIENEMFPVQSGSFDLVVFCEVLEHMDVDPMFALAEINRVLSVGGKLVLTTPNSCSANIVWKNLMGCRPHFYMQYHKDRSPYRHNFEHDVRTVSALLAGAGFSIDVLDTRDVFQPTNVKATDFLKKHAFPTEHRGDDIMVLATKTGPIKNRWPAEVYVG